MKNRFLASTVVLLAVIAVASIASVPAAAQTPKRPHYHQFVFFQFWQGTRASEAIALRHSNVDVKYATAGIHKSIVQGHEGGTKTVRSNREIHLHENVVRVLSEENPAPLNVSPDDFLFTTPQGTPIDESNFYKREWLPILKAKKIRPRPFYNTRHSCVSFLYSIGAKSGFISSRQETALRRWKATMRSTSKRPMTTGILAKIRSKKVQP